MIAQSLTEILQRIRLASQRAGRDPQGVTLVAVAKGQPVGKIIQAIKAGQRDFGENYAQELLEHCRGVIHDAPTWHFIGHLQRNKVKQVIGLVSLIHSVDSIDLALEIDKRAAVARKIQKILIEVNLGGEKSKSGIAPEKVEDLVRGIALLDHVALEGLMTMPPPEEDPHPHFRRLREIRDAINGETVYKTSLTELSMGMTNDFEVAIEEGATIVRIGTAIFGPRGQ